MLPTVVALATVLSLGGAAFGTIANTRVNSNPTVSSDQKAPAMSGSRIVWEDNRNGNWDIYLYDVATASETVVCTQSASQEAPDVSDNWVVWTDERNGVPDVFAWSIATGEETAVVAASGQQYAASVWMNTVAWSDGRNGTYEIWVRNLGGEAERAVATGTVDKVSPDVSGDTVVWLEFVNPTYTIRAKDIYTRVETVVASGDLGRPSIDGTVVVWEDGRNEAGGDGDHDIYMKDLVTGVESVVTTAQGWDNSPSIAGGAITWSSGGSLLSKPVSGGAATVVASGTAHMYAPAACAPYFAWVELGADSWDLFYVENTPPKHAVGSGDRPSRQQRPAVAGDRIIWADDRNGFDDIYMKDLSSGEETSVTKATNRQTDPAISGDLAVWEDVRNGTWDIYAMDLVTHEETAVCTSTANQLHPAVSGRRIVWQDERNADRDVYVKDLDTGVESVISTGYGDQGFPAISGETVAYESWSSAGNRIFIKDLGSGDTTAVSWDGWPQTNPSTDGKTVVWTEPFADMDIWMRDLATGQDSALTTSTGNQRFPRVSGDICVWIDDSAGYPRVVAMNIHSRETTFVTDSASALPANVSIDGTLVAWTDYREGTGTNDPNVYMADVSGLIDVTSPGPVTAFTATAGNASVALSWTNPSVDFGATRILRSTGGYATSATQTAGQTKVYEGSASSRTDPSLTNGTTYYYTAFVRDASANWSTPATAAATPAAPPSPPVYEPPPYVAPVTPALPGHTLYTPVAPSTVYYGRTFTISGLFKPRHKAGLYSVKLEGYRYERQSNGTYKWVRRATWYAKNYNYSTYTKYIKTGAVIRLRGKWKVRAVHTHTGYLPKYSGYRYLYVK